MSLASADRSEPEAAQTPSEQPADAGSAAAIDLALYTDTTAMQALLQQQLPGFGPGGLRITALAVSNVRRNTSVQRKPSPMTLCWELQVSDSAGRHRGSQRLVAEVFRPGLSAAAYAQQDRAALVPPAFGEPLVHLPALNLLCWALPNDPGLPQLPLLLDPERAVAALPPAERAAAAAGGLRVELVRHTPQRRATVRCTFAAGSRRAERVLYGKTFFDQRAADVDARFAWFWQQARQDARAPLVAEPLGFDAATHTVWQASAVGLPLWPRLATAEGRPLMARVAHALALLHAAPLAPQATTTARSVAHWLAEARRRQNKIGRVDVAFGERAAAIAAAIEAHAAHPATRALSLIHGDCHPDQFWVRDGRVVIFDFDEFTLGDPMEDLAEFVIKLEQGGAAPSLAQTLVERYAAAAPARFDARALAWHLVVQSLLQVSRAFIYQQPGWAQELERRLVATEARVAGLR
jgi:Phosphotransferase enzyme family